MNELISVNFHTQRDPKLRCLELVEHAKTNMPVKVPVMECISKNCFYLPVNVITTKTHRSIL